MKTVVLFLGTALSLILSACGKKDEGPGFTRNFYNCTVVYENGHIKESSELTCREFDENCPCAEDACAEINFKDSLNMNYLCLEDGEEQVHVVHNNTDNINVYNENGEVLVIFNNNESDTLDGDINIVEAGEAHIVGIDVHETVMKGNVNMHDGRVTLRNLTIQGDVSLNDILDSSGLSHCEIHSNLNVHTVGTTIKNCNIYGNINIDRDSVTLINVGMGGRLALHGTGHHCENFFHFTDADSNFRVDSTEIGGPVNCN